MTLEIFMLDKTCGCITLINFPQSLHNSFHLDSDTAVSSSLSSSISFICASNSYSYSTAILSSDSTSAFHLRNFLTLASSSVFDKFVKTVLATLAPGVMFLIPRVTLSLPAKLTFLAFLSDTVTLMEPSSSSTEVSSSLFSFPNRSDPYLKKNVLVNSFTKNACMAVCSIGVVAASFLWM